MLVLIILATMFLTACTTIITAEEVKKFKNIAYEIKNSESYKLPDGCKISYPDPTTTSKIAISIAPDNLYVDKIIAVFDMTKDEPQLLYYNEKINKGIIFFIMLGIILGFIIALILNSIGEKSKKNNPTA